MKVIVTANGPGLDSEVDPRFGRAEYFLLIETGAMSCEPLDNSNMDLYSGAGIQSAKLVTDTGAEYVLTGNCGPKAHRALTAAGVRVVVGCSGRVEEVVRSFERGELAVAEAPNVAGHFGMEAGSGPAGGECT